MCVCSFIILSLSHPVYIFLCESGRVFLILLNEFSISFPIFPSEIAMSEMITIMDFFACVFRSNEYVGAGVHNIFHSVGYIKKDSKSNECISQVSHILGSVRKL